MKRLQIFHLVVTSLLLLTALGLALLILAGIMEVRFHTSAAVNSQPRTEFKGAKAKLIVVRGANPATEYPIFEGQNVLGRADQKPVDIDLEFQEQPGRIWSSRQHAIITCENGSLFIEDLNSSNATYVNRNKVDPGRKQPLQANDIIQIGEVQLKVVM
jgi:hypothetical protein